MNENQSNSGFRLGKFPALIIALLIAIVSGIGDELLTRGPGLSWVFSFVVFLGGYVVFFIFYVIYQSKERLSFPQAIDEAKRIFQSNVRVERDEDGKNVFPDELKILGLSMIIYYVLSTFVGAFLVNYLDIMM